MPHWIEDVRKYAGSSIVQLLIGEQGWEGPQDTVTMGLSLPPPTLGIKLKTLHFPSSHCAPELYLFPFPFFSLSL